MRTAGGQARPPKAILPTRALRRVRGPFRGRSAPSGPAAHSPPEGICRQDEGCGFHLGHKYPSAL